VALRSGHGNGAGQPRVEVLPADELPEGVPSHADALSRSAAAERGKFARGNRRSVLGGRSRAGQSRLANRLGLATLAADAPIAPYMRSAVSFRRAQCAELARTVGGGVCGPGPSSVVASAALALAWSRYLADKAATSGDAELATKAARLGETSRQHLLAAHELCAREAQARPRAPFDPLARWRKPEEPKP
jgi:hypothetical protein